MGDQRLDLGVGHAGPGEVGVVERQRQAGDRPHELARRRRASGRSSRRGPRREKVMPCARAVSHRQASSSQQRRQRVGLGDALEVDARQRGDVPAAALGRELERPREPVARLPAHGRVGVVGGERGEVRGGLEEDVGRLQAAVAELAGQLAGRARARPRRRATARGASGPRTGRCRRRRTRAGRSGRAPCRAASSGNVKSAQASFGVIGRILPASSRRQPASHSAAAR